VEKKLSALATKRGTQVDKLVNVVHENGQIQEQIKQILQAQVVNQLVSSVIRSDRDRDFSLSTDEVQELCVTLSVLPGVDFDQVAFNAFIQADNGTLTLDEVLSIMHQIDDATVPEADKVFKFQPKAVLAQ
jgi:macrodomain Ter protein organizer (MatP/YcbG family)